ncbi:MAG: hypothetical protein OXC55_02460 [Chloroflexi bacterium]|nr:hypothetical protein [Chloroflexota bacterium]
MPTLLVSDIMDMVSAEEVECVRTAVGEDTYNPGTIHGRHDDC